MLIYLWHSRTGKTTLAKILANAINCLNPHAGNPCGECEICRSVQDGSLMDIMEIDAASNNSVDNIRRITDEVLFLPTLTNIKFILLMKFICYPAVLLMLC